MNIKRFFKEIKEELDMINDFREKLLYPASPFDKINDLKGEKEKENQ